MDRAHRDAACVEGGERLGHQEVTVVGPSAVAGVREEQLMTASVGAVQ